jgi:chemotaxis signal transduction protein
MIRTLHMPMDFLGCIDLQEVSIPVIDLRIKFKQKRWPPCLQARLVSLFNPEKLLAVVAFSTASLQRH